MSSTSSNDETWTILKLLEWTTPFLEKKGSPSPRLDAELLLSFVTGLERIHLYTQFDRPLVPDELARYRELIARRSRGTPVAYLLGEKPFWSLDLKVDPRVLIPRPDTETLVQAALKSLPDGPRRVIDIGTGSGAIALAIAAERPDAHLAATDISADALAVARENAALNDLEDRVTFLEGDLFAPFAIPEVGDLWIPADMIVSNPPYIGESEKPSLDRSVLDFEPHGALFAGPDGLDVLRRLVLAAHEHLRPGGALLVEIGFTQGAAVADLFADAGFAGVAIEKDLAGQDRVVYGHTSEAS